MKTKTTAPQRRRYAPRLPREQRREQLLDVALEIIAERGYGGVSMEAVARDAGVAKPVVYELFPGRGELLQALLQREEARAFRALQDALPTELVEGADPDEVLVHSVKVFLRSVTDNPRTWRLIVLPADGTPDLVREHVEAGRRIVATQLVALIGWGSRERRGLDHLDLELAAQSLLILGEHAARLVLTDPEHFTPERFAAFAASLLAALPPASLGH